jgi:hypothetical protein
MKKYLLNVTFYAGSNDEEDTDRDLFILCVDKEITETEMENIFEKVNELLNDYDVFEVDAKGENFPISYGQGININTLMEGVGIYTKGKVIKVYGDCGQIEKVDNCYAIEQWQ